MPESMSKENAKTATPIVFKPGFDLHRRAEAGPRKTKIHIKELDFFYGHLQGLKHVSLDIPEKRVTALIGPSGCGKSTLLRVLNRMFDLYPKQHAAGLVTMDGVDLLFDNVAFGIRLREKLSRSELKDRVEECLTKAALWTEVKDRLATPALGLSGGQQQRLCIARMIAMRPEVLLLDEPTSALDPMSTGKIEGLIDALKHDFTIVIVTHSMQQAARCADQVAFMYLGEMIEIGSAEQIFTRPRSKHTEAYIAGRFG